MGGRLAVSRPNSPTIACEDGATGPGSDDGLYRDHQSFAENLTGLGVGIIGNARRQMMDVMIADIAGGPMQDTRHFEIGRALQRRIGEIPVATSALRDARNSQAFLEWVRSVTGWKVEIISGLEEARLIHLGLVSSTLRGNASPVLMMDLGGGSCELTISSKRHIRDTVSLPLGAVRLTNEFLHHDPPRKAELRQLRGFVERDAFVVVGRANHEAGESLAGVASTVSVVFGFC